MLKSRNLTPAQLKIKNVLKPIVEGILKEEPFFVEEPSPAALERLETALKHSWLLLAHLPPDKDIQALERQIEIVLKKLRMR